MLLIIYYWLLGLKVASLHLSYALRYCIFTGGVYPCGGKKYGIACSSAGRKGVPTVCASSAGTVRVIIQGRNIEVFAYVFWLVALFPLVVGGPSI